MRKYLLITFFLVCEHFISYTQEIQALNKELEQAKSIKNEFGIIDKMCAYYTRSGNLDSQRITAFQLLDIAKKEKDDSLLIRAYIMVNGFYWMSGNFPLSIEYSFKAINLAEKNNDILTCARTYSNVAWAYINLKNYTTAAKLAKKAIELAKQLPSGTAYLMAACDNLAIAYLESGMADSALYYTQLANSMNVKLKDTYEQCTILDQFGRIYEMQNDYDLAETYYKKAISLSNSIHEHVPTSISCINYCRILLKQNRLIEAKQFATLGLREALYGKGKRQVIESAELLRQIYDKEQRVDSAYYFSKMANVYRDSTFNEQQTNQVQSVTQNQQLYESEKNEKKKEEETNRKHNLQYAAIALALVTFMILFFLFSQSIIANQKLIKFLGVLALLLVFEFINLYIHPYLNNLTNHSLPLMLVIMVGIASLLIPLHHKLEHWVTSRLVEKNRKIRLAAAKKTIATLEGEDTY